jgi:hypothetical protein
MYYIQEYAFTLCDNKYDKNGLSWSCTVMDFMYIKCYAQPTHVRSETLALSRTTKKQMK